MGYRLEISSIEPQECGGKLFGYISDEDLHTCKSWKWMKDKGFLEKEYEDCWTYSFNHQMELWHDEFEEFIKLYIEDYNRLSPYGNTLSIDDFKSSLSHRLVLVEWY